jgi:hypothetical protein
VLVGQWDCPRGAPPYPLALLVPEGRGHDRHGDEGLLPGHSPYLELALGLARQGFAAFRWDQPRQVEDLSASLRAAWQVATSHRAISRARVAILAPGEACRTFLRALPRLRTWREPRGGVLLGPPPDLDLSNAAGLALSAILLGAGPGPGPKEVEGVLAAEASRAGCSVAFTVLPDATPGLQRESDWIAGRAIPHPDLLPRVSAALLGFFLPVWEPPARPPGTAIG